LLHRLSDARDGRRRYAHNHFGVGIDLQYGLSLRECTVAVVLAGTDGIQLDVPVFGGHAFFYVLDPLILIRGAERPGDDYELAFTAEDLSGPVHQCIADALGRRL